LPGPTGKPEPREKRNRRSRFAGSREVRRPTVPSRHQR